MPTSPRMAAFQVRRRGNQPCLALRPGRRSAASRLDHGVDEFEDVALFGGRGSSMRRRRSKRRGVLALLVSGTAHVGDRRRGIRAAETRRRGLALR